MGRVRWIFGDSFPDGLSHAADEQEPIGDETNLEFYEELKGLTYAERKSVLPVPAASDPEDLKLFSRWDFVIWFWFYLCFDERKNIYCFLLLSYNQKKLLA